jgi:hypothetical protein
LNSSDKFPCCLKPDCNLSQWTSFVWCYVEVLLSIYGSTLNIGLYKLVTGVVTKRHSVQCLTALINGKTLIKTAFSLSFISSCCSAHVSRSTCILYLVLYTMAKRIQSSSVGATVHLQHFPLDMKLNKLR